MYRINFTPFISREFWNRYYIFPTIIFIAFISLIPNRIYSQIRPVHEGTTLFPKDIFLIGFDNEIDKNGSDQILIANRVPLSKNTQFGILGHGITFNNPTSSWSNRENGLDYINITYTGSNDIAAGNILSIKLLHDERGKISNVDITNKDGATLEEFEISIIGQPKGLSTSASFTSLHIYSGTWYEKEGQNKLLGQAIDAIHIGSNRNQETESIIPPELAQNMMNIPLSSINPSGSQTVSSIIAIIDCDGLLYLCDISEIINNLDNWDISQGTDGLDTFIEELEEEICDLVPDPCILNVAINVGNYVCSGYIPLWTSIQGNYPPYNVLWGYNGSQGQPTSGLGQVNGYTAYQTGEYAVTVTDNSGCQTISQVFVDVPDLLSVDIGPDHTVCEGESITLEASVTGGETPYSYQWSEGSQAPYQDLNNIDNSMQVSVIVTDNLDCEATDDVQVNLIPDPELYLEWSNCLLQFETEISDVDNCDLYYERKPNGFDWYTYDNYSDNFKPFPNEFNELAKYRIKADCPCGEFYSNEVNYLPLKISEWNCNLYVDIIPCVPTEWRIERNFAVIAYGTGMPPSPFAISQPGRYQLFIKCGNNCNWRYSNSKTINTCGSGEEESTFCSTMNIDWGFQVFDKTETYSITESAEIVVDFDAFTYPDHLTIIKQAYPTPITLVDSKSYSSTYSTNEMQSIFDTSTCTPQGGDNLDNYCCGQGTPFFASFCVHPGDVIEVTVDAHSCDMNYTPQCSTNGIDCSTTTQYHLQFSCLDCGNGNGGESRPIQEVSEFLDSDSPEFKPEATYIDNKNKDVVIIPNPANNQVQIIQESGIIDNLLIISTSGTSIFNQSDIASNSLIVDTSKFPEGLYLIIINNESGKSTKKLIINH